MEVGLKAYPYARTRRNLFRIAAAAAASIPFIVSAGSSIHAHEKDQDDRRNKDWDDRETKGADFDRDEKDWDRNHSCFLKSTRISTPRGERCVEELQIGDEVHTHDGPKPIKW